MKSASAMLLWLLLAIICSPVKASPAQGPYGLLETRSILLQANLGNSITSYFGSHRYGSYYVNSSNGCSLENTLYELDEYTHQWYFVANFGCSQSTIELFLKEGGDYKIVSKVVGQISNNPYYQIELGLQVYSKYRYYAQDYESCQHFPGRFGRSFNCGSAQCNKTNQNWNQNDDQAYWCKI